MRSIQESSSDAKVTWALIETKMKKELYELTQLKFEMPNQQKKDLDNKFKDLMNDIERKFRELNK
jgi:V-type H+-transporting ATPase subunit A